MRRTGFTLAVLLSAVPAAFAQLPPQPAQPPERVPVPGSGVPVGLQPGGVPAGVPAVAPAPAPVAPVDAAIVTHLQAWQKVMSEVTNFYTECTLTRRHLVLNKTSTYGGSIICMKPNLARMRIEQKPVAGQQPNPNNYTAYICTGQAVYEYDGAAKQVTEYPLANGGVGDNLLLAFMSGSLTANAIMQRFDLKLLKEDQHYVYLEIRPRLPRDKQEFESMTLVLFRPTVAGVAYLPRTVVMRKNNGQEEENWDFPQPRVNVEGVNREHFTPVQPPKDWKVQRAQAQAAPPQPRVVRPGTP